MLSTRCKRCRYARKQESIPIYARKHSDDEIAAGSLLCSTDGCDTVFVVLQSELEKLKIRRCRLTASNPR
jgi:hypothetical protein